MASASSLLFTLSGQGSPEQHLRSIFDACDLEFDGQLHRHEVKQTVLSLLRMREQLLVARTEEDSPMVMFAVPVRRKEPHDLIELQRRRQKRFELLKKRGLELYGSCKTMAELLDTEAELLTNAVFREADIGDDHSPAGQESQGKVISQAEFNAWASGKPTKTSKEFFKLFDAFKGYTSALPETKQ